ncbi:MAG: hypothetical protein WBL93_09360 [Lutisporaceae bacterium]
MEEPLKDNDIFKYSIISRINELLDCVNKLGKTDSFEIIVKHKNGELITETSFSETKSIIK